MPSVECSASVGASSLGKSPFAIAAAASIAQDSGRVLLRLQQYAAHHQNKEREKANKESAEEQVRRVWSAGVVLI